jgi:NADH dehydrogenase FAD-containing subunit
VCTGQKPNSGILQHSAPEAISKTTHRILVRPTLQLQSPQAFADNVFALGDVAETGGPKMARAAFFQSMIVAENIVSMIGGSFPPRTYQPKLMIEGPIKLTLGKVSGWNSYPRGNFASNHRVLTCIQIGSNLCFHTGSRRRQSCFHSER